MQCGESDRTAFSDFSPKTHPLVFSGEPRTPRTPRTVYRINNLNNQLTFKTIDGLFINAVYSSRIISEFSPNSLRMSLELGLIRSLQTLSDSVLTRCVELKAKTRAAEIDHFRIAVCLFFRTSRRAKRFIRK